MKIAFLLVHQYAESLPPGILDILLTIHDSVLFQVKAGHDDVVAEVVRLMESAARVLELDVPIPVELGGGSNWAEASYAK
jgi:DNA polymerase I-like protein with 3'-5' exonuclease and polymerase domains